MIYSSAFALALLSTAFAAPAIVESPFGLVSTLSTDSKLDGYIVFSKDDGTLWLRNPENVEYIQMLANMDIEGKVVGVNGTSLHIGDDSALTLSSDKTTDLLIDEESALSTGDSVILAACPSDDGYQVFSGANTCENRIYITLRAVTDGSAPLADANNLDVKKNYCCLKSCFRCGGCNTHSHPSTCDDGCSQDRWTPGNRIWGSHHGNGNSWNFNNIWNNHHGHGENCNCNNGNHNNNNNWNGNSHSNGCVSSTPTPTWSCTHQQPTTHACWDNSGSTIIGTHREPEPFTFTESCTHEEPTSHSCSSCGDGSGSTITGTHREPEPSTSSHSCSSCGDGTGPTITGAHREPESSAITSHSCPTCGDGTGPIVTGTHREPEAAATITSIAPHYTNGTSNSTASSIDSTYEPATVVPFPVDGDSESNSGDSESRDGEPESKDDEPESKDDKSESRRESESKNDETESKDGKLESKDDGPESKDDEPESCESESKDGEPELKNDEPETKDNENGNCNGDVDSEKNEGEKAESGDSTELNGENNGENNAEINTEGNRDLHYDEHHQSSTLAPAPATEWASSEHTPVPTTQWTSCEHTSAPTSTHEWTPYTEHHNSTPTTVHSHEWVPYRCTEHHNHPAPAPIPTHKTASCGCQGNAHNNHSEKNEGSHKNAFAGILKKAPCPKNFLCGLCGSSTSCGCEQPAHHAPVHPAPAPPPAPVPHYNHDYNSGSNGQKSGSGPFSKLKSFCPGKFLCGGCKSCR